jgi:PAS domain S-box-containing protein
MTQQQAPTPPAPAEVSMDVKSNRRATSPLVAPGEIVIEPSSFADDSALRRDLLLGDLGRRVLTDLEPRALARVTTETLGRGLDLDLCVLLGMRGNRLVPRTNGVWARPAITFPADFGLDAAAEIVETIRLEGELVAGDVMRELAPNSPLARLARAVPVRAILVVPIIFGARMRALLVLGMQREPRSWTLDDRLVAREASTIVSVAQRQAELLDEARRVGERETRIRQIGRALRSSLGLDHVLTTASERIGDAVTADRLTLWKCDQDNALQPIWRYSGLGGRKLERAEPSADPIVLSASLASELLSTHASVVADNGWKTSDSVHGSGAHVTDRRLLVCPIVVRGNMWGLFEIERRAAGWVWREGESSFVSEVAEQLATAIHQAQLFETVLRSQHEWESTFDGLADAVLIYDDERNVRRTNRAAASMLNSVLGELVGKSCCRIGFCGSQHGCAVERVLVERERVVIEVLSPRTYHVLHVTVDPILGEEGEVIGAVQLVRDLDDLRRTEAELRRQQHFLVNLVESAHDAIFVIDLAGRLVWSNSHLAGLTGRLVSEMLGKSYTVFVPDDERVEFEQYFDAARGGETRRFEASIFNVSSGDERRVVVTYSPIHEDGKVVSVLGVARDVTEEKSIAERSQQADKLRALGQLASGVAHDVNNDLAAILGRVQRLMRKPEYGDLRRDLEVIETAALDSAQTVRRIQNFARQQGHVDFEPVDLNGLVRDAIEITRTRWLDDAQSRGVKYTVEFEAADVRPVLGDGSQLREVFVNLIINALDAMPKGGALRVSSTVPAESEVQVRFVDDGVGIPRRIRERIFEPFFSTKGASGTGMGLAVSYGIVTRHSGRIDVDSEPGRGAIFTLTFPLTTVTSESVPAPSFAPIGPLTVLVIDDEDVVREVLADVLDEQGHAVVQAESGADGIAEADRGSHYDVVFTDLSMPEMDGWAVARHIRTHHPETKIVLVTGYGVSVAAPDGEADLIDAVIGKPFEYDDIAELLQRLYG